MDSSNLSESDTTWEEDVSADENINPNVTRHIKLRSGLISSKDGVTTKYTVKSVCTPKRKLRQTSNNLTNSSNSTAAAAAAAAAASTDVSSRSVGTATAPPEENTQDESNTLDSSNEAINDSSMASQGENLNATTATATQAIGHNNVADSIVPHDFDLHDFDELANESAIAAIAESLMAEGFDFVQFSSQNGSFTNSTQLDDPFFGSSNIPHSVQTDTQMISEAGSIATGENDGSSESNTSILPNEAVNDSTLASQDDEDEFSKSNASAATAGQTAQFIANEVIDTNTQSGKMALATATEVIDNKDDGISTASPDGNSDFTAANTPNQFDINEMAGAASLMAQQDFGGFGQFDSHTINKNTQSGEMAQVTATEVIDNKDDGISIVSPDGNSDFAAANTPNQFDINEMAGAASLMAQQDFGGVGQSHHNFSSENASFTNSTQFGDPFLGWRNISHQLGPLKREPDVNHSIHPWSRSMYPCKPEPVENETPVDSKESVLNDFMRMSQPISHLPAQAKWNAEKQWLRARVKALQRNPIATVDLTVDDDDDLHQKTNAPKQQ